MSGPYRCTACDGFGRIVTDEYEDRWVECNRCKGSGYLFLRCAGHGIPPLKPGEDHYEPAPKGGNY